MITIFISNNLNKYRLIANNADNNGEVTIELLGSELWNFIYIAQKIGGFGIRTR